LLAGRAKERLGRPACIRRSHFRSTASSG
jgi:hypothetical protein